MQKDYKFKAKEFYHLLDKQEYRCALTGRNLTPETTTAEHIVQLQDGGVHELLVPDEHLVHGPAREIVDHEARDGTHGLEARVVT